VYACRKRRLGAEHADTERMGKKVGDCLCFFREGKVSEEEKLVLSAGEVGEVKQQVAGSVTVRRDS